MSPDESRKLAVVILAAGKGTRMKSDLPKVLHPLAGRPLLAYTLEAARALGAGRIIVLVGHGADQVRQAFAGQTDLTFVLQEPQLGTGHAVMTAAPALADWIGPILILCGDVPGLKPATLTRLLEEHQGAGSALTVLGMELADPGAYGRLVTQGDQLLRIVEYRDATDRERAICLVNAGIYVASPGPLSAALPKLSDHNDQREYYLTDLVEILRAQGERVGFSLCPDPDQVAGVNSREELMKLERALMGSPSDGQL